MKASMMSLSHSLPDLLRTIYSRSVPSNPEADLDPPETLAAVRDSGARLPWYSKSRTSRPDMFDVDPACDGVDGTFAQCLGH
jgi:hypothetical protein